LITALAGPDGWIDSLDILMAARGTGSPGVPPVLVSRPDLAISEGIAGLTELSFELEPGQRGQGGGATLARDALSAIPAGQIALAAVAPGNAASLRALLAASFAPLGSLQLFRRAGHNPGAPH
jgi:hypothetical protein